MASINRQASSKTVNEGIEKIKQQRSFLADKVKPYWQNLSDRERLLLVVAACFISILICYLFVIEPLKIKLSQKVSIIETQQNDVLWMEQQLPLVQQLRQKNPVLIREDERPLATLIEQTLQQFKLREATQRIVPEDNTTQIWIEKAPFETILNWINSIGKYGVTVNKIDVTPHEDGQGNVDLSLILEK